MIQLKEVNIPIDGLHLKGDLHVPDHPKGLVIFAHGSGSSRLSERNRYVADVLAVDGFATLLFDLLTLNEDTDFQNRFNIELLTERLAEVVDWAKDQTALKGLPVGLFGASTGAAAALCVAAEMGPDRIGALVSRGGRTDLARNSLRMVRSSTLFIVGGADVEVLKLNEQSLASLPATTDATLQIVHDASHLFAEPGALEQVARLASDWFTAKLALLPKASSV